MWLTCPKIDIDAWINRAHDSNIFIHSSIDHFTFLVTRNVDRECDWMWKLADSRDWQLAIVLAMRMHRKEICLSFMHVSYVVRFGIAPLSRFRVFVTKKVKREKYCGLDNESGSRGKMRVQKQMWWKTERASRHAKCFSVLCVCVNENIFQKGDILLVHIKIKNEDNCCA